MKQMSKHILPLTITAAILAATLCSCGNNTTPSSTAPVSSEVPAVSSETPTASSEVSASSKEPAANSESAASSEQPESSSEMPAASSETPESSEAAEPEQASESVEAATADNSTVETTTAPEQSAPAAPEEETVKQQSNIKESYTDKVPKISEKDKVSKEEAESLPGGGLGLIKEYSYIYDPDNNIVYEYDENGNPTGRGYNPDEYDPKDPYGNVPGKYGELLREGKIENPGHIVITDDMLEEDGSFDIAKFLGCN